MHHLSRVVRWFDRRSVWMERQEHFLASIAHRHHGRPADSYELHSRFAQNFRIEVNARTGVLARLRLILFSLLGDVALATAMICTIIYAAHYYDFQPISHYPAVNFSSLGDLYGAVVFLFGIHVLIVPLHNSAAEPAKFERTLNWSIVSVVVSNMVRKCLCSFQSF